MARVLPDSPTLVPLQESPDFALELSAMRRGAKIVAGVDEAGRGPLAGPVVAAAVILDPDNIPDGLDDSKKLLPERREELFARILASATVSIASTSAALIDRIDIRKASLDAMRRAVAGLPVAPRHVFADGRDRPPGLTCESTAVVGGDGLCLSIAAASIVAKVSRDRLMRRMAAHYPQYGFETHVGYSTRTHLEAIVRFGPCALHRMSFKPLRQA